MSLTHAIAAFVDVVTAAPDAQEDSIVAALTAQGFSGALAERLVAFVPLAFARVVLEERGARFSEGYQMRDLDGGRIQYGRLPEEEVYLAARQYATRAGTEDERVLEVAQRSAEMDAAQKLLRPGEDVGILVFTEPVLLRVLPKTQS